VGEHAFELGCNGWATKYGETRKASLVVESRKGPGRDRRNFVVLCLEEGTEKMNGREKPRRECVMEKRVNAK